MYIRSLVSLSFFNLFISSTRGAVHDVIVGGLDDPLQFKPEFVNAEAGDSIRFAIQSNHTVTQSTLESPCVPLSRGFDSDFVFNPEDRFIVAELNITDTNPIWVHCRQTGHCKQGMVFAINPGDDFDTFKQNALESSETDTSQAGSTIDCPEVVSGTTHIIAVGQDNSLTFSPSNVSAAVGDTISFRFMGSNHSVVQSSFAQPCSPLASSSSSGQVGFDTGFMSIESSQAAFPTYNITVNDTAPIWAFCGQTKPVNHCQQGMVFAVNADVSGNDYEAFLANAMGNGPSGVPGTLKTNVKHDGSPSGSDEDGDDDEDGDGKKKGGALSSRNSHPGLLVALLVVVATALA